MSIIEMHDEIYYIFFQLILNMLVSTLYHSINFKKIDEISPKYHELVIVKLCKKFDRFFFSRSSM